MDRQPEAASRPGRMARPLLASTSGMYLGEMESIPRMWSEMANAMHWRERRKPALRMYKRRLPRPSIIGAMTEIAAISGSEAAMEKTWPPEREIPQRAIWLRATLGNWRAKAMAFFQSSSCCLIENNCLG